MYNIYIYIYCSIRWAYLQRYNTINNKSASFFQREAEIFFSPPGDQLLQTLYRVIHVCLATLTCSKSVRELFTTLDYTQYLQKDHPTYELISVWRPLLFLPKKTVVNLRNEVCTCLCVCACMCICLKNVCLSHSLLKTRAYSLSLSLCHNFHAINSRYIKFHFISP